MLSKGSGQLEDVYTMNIYDQRNDSWVSQYAFFPERNLVVYDMWKFNSNYCGNLDERHHLVVKRISMTDSGVEGVFMFKDDRLVFDRYGQPKVVLTFKTVADKVKALRKWFGIDLEEEDLWMFSSKAHRPLVYRRRVRDI